MAMSMTEERFWELVSFVDWPNSQHEKTEPVKQRLMARLSLEEAEAMDDHFDQKRDAVARALDAHLEKNNLSVGLGDDSYYDLLGHVVGLGRVEYEQALSEPARMVTLARTRRFTEGFSYVIPSRDDYEGLDPERYFERARELAKQYMAVLELPVVEEMKSRARRMVHLLRPLERGEWQLFLSAREEGEAMAKQIVKDYEPLLRGIGVRSGGDVLHNEWSVLNLYTDVQDWLVDFPEAQRRAAAETPAPAQTSRRR